MLSFNHTNVMPLIGLCIEGEMPLLIMPFMSNGSLLDYVRQNRDKLFFIENSNEVGFKAWCQVFSLIFLTVYTYKLDAPLTTPIRCMHCSKQTNFKLL